MRRRQATEDSRRGPRKISEHASVLKGRGFSAKKVRRVGKLKDRQLTMGLDPGDRSSFYFFLNGADEVILQAKVTTNQEAMKKTVGNMPRNRIAPETGTCSP
jgi:hypothetical protein